ncbi:hypothetical protein GGR58DRAFT_505090 [Xylaria digitata]|nr:hypothetical protein GGR58DRAFT_505090 [Xylaria digitata]
MSSQPTDDELEWLLEKCETALWTVRQIINACPSDLIAKIALPPLESSLRHLANDARGSSGNRDSPSFTLRRKGSVFEFPSWNPPKGLADPISIFSPPKNLR